MASWSSGDELEQGASKGGSHDECCTSRSQDLKKGLWTPEEDAILTHCVQRFKEGNWSTIAHKSGLKRSGKSCRLRWVKHLSPTVNTGPLSEEEQGRVIEMQRQYGNKWALIAQFMPGRSDNTIKNFWNSFRKRMERRRHAAYLSASALTPGSPASSLVIRGPPSASTWPGDGAPHAADASGMPLTGPESQAGEEDAEAAVSSSAPAPAAPSEENSLPAPRSTLPLPPAASRSSTILPASHSQAQGKPTQGRSHGALPAADIQGAGGEDEGQGGTGSLPLGAESEEALGSSPSGTAVDSEWHHARNPSPPRAPRLEGPLQGGQGAGGAGIQGGAPWNARARASSVTGFESAEGCVMLPQMQRPAGSSGGTAERSPLQALRAEGSPGVIRPLSGTPPPHSSPLSLPRSAAGSFRRSAHSPLMPSHPYAAMPATATSPLAGTPSPDAPAQQLPMLLPNEQCVIGRVAHKRGSPPLPPAASRASFSRSSGRAPPSGPKQPAPPSHPHAQGAYASAASPGPGSALSTAAAVSPQLAPTPTSRHPVDSLQRSSGRRPVQQNLSSAFSSTGAAGAPGDATMLGGPSPDEGAPTAGDCPPVALDAPPPGPEQVPEMLGEEARQPQSAADSKSVSLWTADAGIPDPVLAKKLGQLRDAKRLWDSIMDSPRGMCQALRMSMPSSLRHMPALGTSPLAPAPNPDAPAAPTEAAQDQQQQQQPLQPQQPQHSQHSQPPQQPQQQQQGQGAAKGSFLAARGGQGWSGESEAYSGDASDPTMLCPAALSKQAAPERAGPLPLVKREHPRLLGHQGQGRTAPAADEATPEDGCPQAFGSPEPPPPAAASGSALRRAAHAREGAGCGMPEPRARWTAQLPPVDPSCASGAPTMPQAAGEAGEFAGRHSNAMEEEEEVDAETEGTPGGKRALGEEEGEEREAGQGARKRVRRESSFRSRQPASLSITRPALAAAALAGVRALAAGAAEEQRRGPSRCVSPLTALGLTDSCRTPDALMAFRGLQSPLATSSLFSSPQQCGGDPFWVWDSMGGGHLNSSPSPTPFTPRMAQLATTP